MRKTNETFYFLKVELGIDSCEEVSAVERLKHGPEYLWLWIRLALKYTNYDGILCRRIGDKVLPLTPDDIEAEMKGGFTDVSIKDGVKTLIDANLIFINSSGFMQITGLVLSGDPLEPVLHKQNSNKTDIRPLSVGKDSKVAAYHRNYRKLKKDEEIKLLEAPSYQTMTYAEVAKKAKCTKQTVCNYLKNSGMEQYTISQGQKKLIPLCIGQYLICVITKKSVPQTIFDSLQFYGFDSLCQPSKPSNSYQIFDGQPSKINSKPSMDEAKTADKQCGFDGFANANFDTNSNTIIPLIENKRNIEIDDDYVHISRTVKPTINLEELFHVGFEREPTVNDRSLLSQMYQSCDYEILLSQLKVARAYNAKSLDYVISCIRNLNSQGIISGSDLPDGIKIDINRNVSNVIDMMSTDFTQMSNAQAIEIRETIKSLAMYYTDSELLAALRIMSAYKIYSGDALRFFIHCQNNDSSEIDHKEEWIKYQQTKSAISNLITEMNLD